MDEKLKQVLHKIELLCDQNPEFKRELIKKVGAKEYMLSEIAPEADNFASIMRLQHEKCRKKARNYYKGISDKALQIDLVNDYSQMLWYKSIFEIGKYFVYVNYQVENMLNYYLAHTDFHNKVATNPLSYYYELSITAKYVVKIDVYSFAFDRYNGNVPLPPNKIKSLWAKILYWAIDTNQMEMLEQQKSNFNSIITIRNGESHADSTSTNHSLQYWQNQEDSLPLGFIEKIIKQVRNSVENL